MNAVSQKYTNCKVQECHSSVEFTRQRIVHLSPISSVLDTNNISEYYFSAAIIELLILTGKKKIITQEWAHFQPTINYKTTFIGYLAVY